MNTRRFTGLLLAMTLITAACGDDGDSASDTLSGSSNPRTTSASPVATDPAAPGTTAAPDQPPSFEINDDRQVVIDWEGLEGVSFSAPTPNATDPLFFVHNDPDTDGFFLGLEAYTTGYGSAWTGELGVFDIDCSPTGSGICLHFDPDGPGPAGDLGADFLATGTIEIIRADLDGFEAILTDVAFTDGTAIPGPLAVTGGAAG